MAIRPNHNVSTAHALGQKISTGTAPAYGFRCLGGVVERDSKEFPVLLIIHSQWRLGQTATAIMHYLNGRQIKTRHQKLWQRTTVLKIIERFKDGTVVPDEGL